MEAKDTLALLQDASGSATDMSRRQRLVMKEARWRLTKPGSLNSAKTGLFERFIQVAPVFAYDFSYALLPP